MPITRDLLADGEEVLVDLRPHWVFLFGPLLLTLVAIAAAIAVAVEFANAPVGVAWVLFVMVLVPAVWLAGRVIRWAGMSLIVTTQRMVLRRGLLGRDLLQLRLQRITEIHSTQTPIERLIGVGRLVVEVEGEGQAIAVDDVRRPKSLQRVINNRLDAMGRVGTWEPDRRAVPGSTGSQDLPGSVASSARPAPTADAPTPPHGTAAVRSVPRQRWSGDPPEHTAERSPDRAQGGPSSVSVPDQLIQLDDLRRRGIVTPAEFEAKKAELLGRL